jgi:hypothetical protein
LLVVILLLSFPVGVCGYYAGTFSFAKPNVEGSSVFIAPTPMLTPTEPVVSQATNQPQLVDCTGPDGKHLQVTQQQCDDFNTAWGKNQQYQQGGGSTYQQPVSAPAKNTDVSISCTTSLGTFTEIGKTYADAQHACDQLTAYANRSDANNQQASNLNRQLNNIQNEQPPTFAPVVLTPVPFENLRRVVTPTPTCIPIQNAYGAQGCE